MWSRDTMPLKPPTNNETLDIEKILRILPHRYPFLMVDRVLEVEVGKRIVALKNVTYNEFFFQGHFPKYHVMPGVLIIEAIAQVGGILSHFSLDEPEKQLSFLSKVDKVKFRKPVFPGDQLRLEAEFIRMKQKYCIMQGRALVNGDVVAEGEMMATFVRREE